MSEDLLEQKQSLQRITIALEGQRLQLRVPRQMERRYRQAGEELVHTAQLYRAKYPNASEVGQQSYLAMAALDVSLRLRELQEQVETQERALQPRLAALNEGLEQLLVQAAASLEP